MNLHGAVFQIQEKCWLAALLYHSLGQTVHHARGLLRFIMECMRRILILHFTVHRKIQIYGTPRNYEACMRMNFTVNFYGLVCENYLWTKFKL